MKVSPIIPILFLAMPLSAAGADNFLGPSAKREGTEAFVWNMKLACGTTEQGVTRYGMWEGRMFSRIPGEKDRHIFDVIGINTRHCERHQDPVRGDGYRSVSREIMVYLDPTTGEILDRWQNPWTGQMVDVIHVANDPVNMAQPNFAVRADGSPASVELRHYGDLLVSTREVPLFYTNPLAGDYQDYVGGQYHAMEIFNTFYRTVDFMDAKRVRIGDSRISWQRISKLLPWMLMGDRQGLMIFNATGFSTFDRQRIPPKLMQIIQSRFPQYLEPPPLGDSRPNATTWTITKEWIDAQRAKTNAR